MQALDSFDGDIPIPVVPVLAQPPSNDDASDSSTRSSASASKTRASKRKAAANLTPQKKAKKVTRRSSSGIKIVEPTPKAPASTPPSCPQQKIPIHH
jgi:hypothetical protein